MVRLRLQASIYKYLYVYTDILHTQHMYIYIYTYTYTWLAPRSAPSLPFGWRYLSNMPTCHCLMRPRLFCIFRRLTDRHSLLHHWPIRQVVWDKWLPLTLLRLSLLRFVDSTSPGNSLWASGFCFKSVFEITIYLFDVNTSTCDNNTILTVHQKGDPKRGIRKNNSLSD